MNGMNALRRWVPVLLVIVVAAVVLGTRAAQGGFRASIANTGDSVQTGSLLTAATSGGSTECDLSTATYNPVTAANTATCAGDLTPTGSLAASGTTSQSTTVTDKGSLNASSGSLVSGACGPVQLANSATASDPMLVRGTTLSYAQTGPLTGGTGLGLSGTSGYAADVTQVAGPTTTSFTELIWFRATTGGTLMGFIDTPSTNGPASWDKMLWLDNTGHVVFGVYPGSAVELTSAAGTYADGKWHLAVGVLSVSTGMTLYVDGTSVSNTTKSAQSYNGYWHVGWDNVLNGWTDAPTNPYFTGTLADAAVFPSALSSIQISSLFGSGTQATWNTAVSARGATNSWSLGDDGTTVYTGTIPQVTPAACAFVDVTVGVSTTPATTTSCAFPTGATACTTPSASSRLSTLAGTTQALSSYPTRTLTTTLTLTAQRDATNTTTSSPNAAGLHLTLPMTVKYGAGAFTALLFWNGQDIIL